MIKHPLGCTAALALTMTFLTTACTEQPRCLPEPLTVSTSTPSLGSSVEVSSPSATCALDYAANASYTLELLSDASGPAGRTETITEVASDGSFTADVEIPVTFPAGPATVLVHGSPFDDCPRDDSCAAYQVRLTVSG